jgi:hypothetical protein
MTENPFYQRLSLHDISSDIQKRILSGRKSFLLRAVSRGMKDCIDNAPETVIRLSRQGSSSISTDFFSSFQGILLIKSYYGLSGWLKSYLYTLRQCQKREYVDHSLLLVLDDKNLSILSNTLSSDLESTCSTRFRKVVLSFRDSGNDIQETFSMLSGLEKHIESVELRLEIAPRSPITLLDVIERLAELPRHISFADLTVRYTSSTA